MRASKASADSPDREGVQTLSRYSAKTPLAEIMDDHVFTRVSSFLFPVCPCMIDSSWTIADVPRLLPYHTHVSSQTTVEVLEQLHKEAERGDIFLEIYSDAEKAADPSKENTGLFRLRGRRGAPFAIISSGGGLSYVGSIHEGLPYAIHLSRLGYNAFVLQYRVGSAEEAIEDLARAVSLVFSHAAEYEVSTQDYSLWGASAGARMSAYIGSYGPGSFGAQNWPRPCTVIMQYSGHSDYTGCDPATFACVGDRDGMSPWRTMKRRIDLLSMMGVDTEFHLYSDLGHGFGLGLGTSAEGWIDDALRFWERHMGRS